MVTNQTDPGREDGFLSFGPAILGWTLFAWSAYLIIVFGYRHEIAGRVMGNAATCAALIASFVASRILVRLQPIQTIVPPGRMATIGLVLGGTIGALLVADVVAGVITNLKGQDLRLAREHQLIQMRQDPQVWQVELTPPNFVPKGSYFRLYKPYSAIEALGYGFLYHPAMLASRTLSDSVLEHRKIRYQIGPSGFREDNPLKACRIFAVGDSFVYGYGVDAPDVWPRRLGAAVGEPVCNMGISGAAPAAEAGLIRYLTTQHDVCVKQVLWMLYEGNDLDDDDEPGRDLDETGGLGSALEGTMLQPLAVLPLQVQYESVLRKLLQHELILPKSSRVFGIHSLDGVTWRNPLFRSDVLGLKLFYQKTVEQSQEPRSYIQTHPHRARVERAFRDIRALASQANFDVTVILVPTDVQVYHKEFRDFPPVGEPHVLNWFASLAQASGFRVVNLLPLFQPLAHREMLYLRDDYHFNPHGNEVVAQILADTLRAERGTATAALGGGKCEPVPPPSSSKKSVASRGRNEATP